MYYISPAEAKKTVTELFTSTASAGAFIPIQVTEEPTTRSIIVRGKEKDLDVVDKVIREIDVRTKQVLMEAFIVEATSSFERALGTKLGGAYTRNRERVGGTVGGSTVGETEGTGGAISSGTAAIGSGNDGLFQSGAVGAATSGIGVLRRTGSAVLKIQLDALETEGISKTISNPKLFSLDNQPAQIKQGVQIQLPGSGDSAPQLVDAALILKITPSIIGDGNVLMDIQVNNDTPDRTNPGAVGINKMEITTKLLVADGDIVVIGGIKKNDVASSKDGVPGVSKVPLIGKMFQGNQKSDKLNELLVFIAPRIL